MYTYICTHIHIHICLHEHAKTSHHHGARLQYTHTYTLTRTFNTAVQGVTYFSNNYMYMRVFINVCEIFINIHTRAHTFTYKYIYMHAHTIHAKHHTLWKFLNFSESRQDNKHTYTHTLTHTCHYIDMRQKSQRLKIVPCHRDSAIESAPPGLYKCMYTNMYVYIHIHNTCAWISMYENIFTIYA